MTTNAFSNTDARRRKRDICLMYVSLLLVYLIMTYFAALSPPASDDYIYGLGKNFSLREMLLIEWERYFAWTGRSVGHFFISVMLRFWPLGHVLVTPFFFTGILFFSLLLAFGKNWRATASLWHTALLFALVWYCVPSFGTAFLWVSGAANYCWTLFFTLFFLVHCRFLFDDPSYTPPLWLRLTIPFWGLLAGWSNENTGFFVALAAFAAAVFSWKKTRGVPLWIVVGGIAALAGWTLMVIAPGNMARAYAGISHYGYYINADFLEKFLISFYFWLSAQAWLSPLYLAVSLAVWKAWRDGNLKPLSQWNTGLVFLGLAQATLLPFFFSPPPAERALTAIVVFAVIGAFSVIHTAYVTKKTAALRFFYAAFMCLFVSGLAVEARNFYDCNKIYNERVRLLASASASDHVLVPPFPHANKYFFLGEEVPDVTPDKEYLFNVAVAKFYGVKSVSLSLPPHKEGLHDIIDIGSATISVSRYNNLVSVYFIKNPDEYTPNQFRIYYPSPISTPKGVLRRLMLALYSPLPDEVREEYSLISFYSIYSRKYLISESENGGFAYMLSNFDKDAQIYIGLKTDESVVFKKVKN